MERDPRTLAMPSVRPGTIDRDYRASFLPRLLPPLLDTSHFALAIIISLLLAPPTEGSWGGAVNRWKRKNRSIFRERALDYYPLTVVEEWVSIRLSRVRRRSSRLKTIDGRVRIVLIERSRSRAEEIPVDSSDTHRAHDRRSIFTSCCHLLQHPVVVVTVTVSVQHRIHGGPRWP